MGPMSTREYDLVVIGAGPVGENVADRAVKGGLTAVIVESELVGGECSYWACMPSKALLRAGSALDAARSVGGAREAVTRDLDVAGVLARRDGITHDWNDSSQVEWLQGAGIDLVRGHGRLAGEKRVEVTDADGATTTLVARHAVAVCTGTAALLPDIPGLADASPWTSREATSVRDVPESLVILGGGVVGAEMATAFSSFGCRVTIIARSGLLGSLEPFAGEHVAEALRSGVSTSSREPVSMASRGMQRASSSRSRTAARCAARRSSSRRGARPARSTSDSRAWDSSPAGGSTSTTRCASADSTGSTPWATSTTACC